MILIIIILEVLDTFFIILLIKLQISIHFWLGARFDLESLLLDVLLSTSSHDLCTVLRNTKLEIACIVL